MDEGKKKRAVGQVDPGCARVPKSAARANGGASRSTRTTKSTSKEKKRLRSALRTPRQAGAGGKSERSGEKGRSKEKEKSLRGI